jgi:hypothetical protein
MARFSVHTGAVLRLAASSFAVLQFHTLVHIKKRFEVCCLTASDFGVTGVEWTMINGKTTSHSL